MSLSPNMSLPIPTTSVTTGPAYANNINACMTLIDQHSHTPGSGVPVTTAALNINAALPMNNFSLINTAALTLTDQAGSVPSNGSFYLDGVDAWFVDGNGTPIQLTLGGVVNATSSGISSGTASAAFVAGVLVVKAASTTPANIEGASLLLGNNTANSKFLTLSPPNAMGADYSLTLPAIPGATSIMSLDTSGNIAATYVVDSSTIVISSNIIKVPDGGITKTQLSNPQVQASASCSIFPVSSTTYVDVLNLSGSLSLVGTRPVQLSIQSDGSGGSPSVGVANPNNVTVAIFNSTTNTLIGQWFYDGVYNANYPINMSIVDTITNNPGANTYVVRIKVSGGTGAIAFCKFVLYQM